MSNLDKQHKLLKENWNRMHEQDLKDKASEMVSILVGLDRTDVSDPGVAGALWDKIVKHRGKVVKQVENALGQNLPSNMWEEIFTELKAKLG